MMEVMKKMAAVVDDQNAGDAAYTPMAPDVFWPRLQGRLRSGVRRPHAAVGLYTEPMLHDWRLVAKANA